MKVGMMVGVKRGWGGRLADDPARMRLPFGSEAERARLAVGGRRTLWLRKADIHQGCLVLVNRQHPVRRRLEPTALVNAAAAGLSSPEGTSVTLTGECLRQLARLIAAAEGQRSIAVMSGYRSRQEQKALYRQSVRDNGADYTARYVALPGRSEHETGLAVDVCKLGETPHPIAPDFPDEGACLMFKRLAARYGFVQRYREDKERLTGISCEPWHYRYVGVPHAEWMEELGMCLEEYIEHVRAFIYEGKRLVRMHGEARSEIYYVRAEKGGRTAVPLPDCDRWSCSGNNADGFIVTAYWGARDDFEER